MILLGRAIEAYFSPQNFDFQEVMLCFQLKFRMFVRLGDIIALVFRDYYVMSILFLAAFSLQNDCRQIWLFSSYKITIPLLFAIYVAR